MKDFTVEFLENGNPISHGNYKHLLTSISAENEKEALEQVRGQYKDFCLKNNWSFEEPELRIFV